MANAQEIIASRSFQRCVEFHGHQCPGLAIGYRTAQLAMALLGAGRSGDEELVAVVENDACGVDAVQVLTGCTFGKGNLIFKDYGKQALTLGNRATGKAVRVVLRGNALPGNPERRMLFEKVRLGATSQNEKERFQELHRQKTQQVLEMDAEALFQVKHLDFTFPEKARIFDSEPCARCGEYTMVTRMEESSEGLLCKACRGEDGERGNLE